MFVYLFGTNIPGFYKIGRSEDPERRASEFSTLAMDVHVIHAIEFPEPAALEAVLHRRYASQRISGEWFRLSEADVAFFCSPEVRTIFPIISARDMSGTPWEVSRIRMRDRRHLLGMTQGELSELSRIDQTAISRMETGERVPDWNDICRLCDALGMKVQELR